MEEEKRLRSGKKDLALRHMLMPALRRKERSPTGR